MGFKQNIAWKEGVTRDVLWEGSSFISSLLDEEFLIERKFETRDDFDRIVAFML